MEFAAVATAFASSSTSIDRVLRLMIVFGILVFEVFFLLIGKKGWSNNLSDRSACLWSKSPSHNGSEELLQVGRSFRLNAVHQGSPL